MGLRRDLERAIKVLAVVAPERIAELRRDVDMLALSLEVLAFHLDPARLRSHGRELQHDALDAHAALVRLSLECKAVCVTAERELTPKAVPAPKERKARASRKETVGETGIVRSGAHVVDAEFVDDPRQLSFDDSLRQPARLPPKGKEE